MDISNMFTMIRDVGLVTTIILLCLWGVWQIIIPALIKQQESQMNYYVSEIKTLREDSKLDRDRMFEAFNRNTEVNAKLQNALDQINTQLGELNSEIGLLKKDVTDLIKKVKEV